jgi:polar amino acid transport system substrate-binding protein
MIINDFKIINDTLGHHLGDEVLIKIANIIEKNIRQIDFLGRWGGDEFLIILPETNLAQCQNIVSHLKNQLSKISFTEYFVPP